MGNSAGKSSPTVAPPTNAEVDRKAPGIDSEVMPQGEKNGLSDFKRPALGERHGSQHGS